MPRPKERTGELRRQLLDAALAVLADGGPAAVTTRNVAARAKTSAPAIYELFGDKAGMIRALYFEGFRRLGDAFADLPEPSGSVGDIIDAVGAFRAFTQRAPRLFEVMYTRPFEGFSPTPTEQRSGDTARSVVVDRVQGCLDTGCLEGDAVDIAHAVIGLAIGLATQETAGWLGTTSVSRERRWTDSVRALLSGYATDSPL